MANISEVISSSLLADFNVAYSQKVLPNTIVLVIFLLIGIAGNPLIIYVYEFRLPLSNGRCYIAPLAFFDLGTIIFTSALSLLQNCFKFAYPGQFLCKMVYYFSYAFVNCSLFMWTVIAVQRYRKICKPFAWQMNQDRRKWCILICAGLCFAFFSHMLFVYGVNENFVRERNLTVYVCEQTKSNVLGLLIFQGIGLVLSLANVIAIIFIYCMVSIRIYRIVRGARKSRNKINNGDSGPATTMSNLSGPSDGKSDEQSTKNTHTSCSEAQKIEHRIAFTFMTILLIGLFSYAPSRTLIVYESINPTFWENMTSSKLNLFLFLRRTYIVNHACNVFVYFFFDSLFRKEVKNWMGL